MDTLEAPASAAADTVTTETIDGRIFRTVPLDNEITVGGQKVKAIRLRKPRAGELRGIQMPMLFAMDVETVAKLMPRISTPTLLAEDVYALESEDFAALATETTNFLLSSSQKAAAGL